MTEVDDRLRRTLEVVAGRVETDETAELQLPPPEHVAITRVLRPALVAAAVLVAFGVAGILAWRQGSMETPVERDVVAGPASRSVPTTTGVTASSAEGFIVASYGDLVVKLSAIPPLDGGGGWCVKFTSTSSPVDPAPDVCIDPATPGLNVQRVIIGRRTVVYGLGASVASFTGSMAEDAMPVAQQQGPYGPVRAFAMIWDAPDVNGIIFGDHVDPSTSPLTAVVGTGLPGFEPNPSSPLPVDVPFDDRMLFAYKHQGQVWAILESGANVRLTGNRVTGFPLIAPDGDTVVFPRDAEAIFADLVALDIRTGRERIVGNASSSAFAADGRLAAVLPIDDEVPRTLSILRPGSFDKIADINLEREDGSNGLAWSADGRAILVNSATDGRSRLSIVDVASRTVTPVDVRGTPTDASWRFATGTSRGWPAVRSAGGRTEIGLLTVKNGSGTFAGVAMKTATAEADLNVSRLTGFAGVGRVAVQMVGDAHFTFKPADTDAYVIADEEEIFHVTATGELTYLLSDSRGPSAP